MPFFSAILLLGIALSNPVFAAEEEGAQRLLTEISVGLVSGLAATGSSLVATGIVAALVVWGAMAAASSEA